MQIQTAVFVRKGSSTSTGTVCLVEGIKLLKEINVSVWRGLSGFKDFVDNVGTMPNMMRGVNCANAGRVMKEMGWLVLQLPAVVRMITFWTQSSLHSYTLLLNSCNHPAKQATTTNWANYLRRIVQLERKATIYNKTEVWYLWKASS